jgi:hypothetical protein
MRVRTVSGDKPPSACGRRGATFINGAERCVALQGAGVSGWRAALVVSIFRGLAHLN